VQEVAEAYWVTPGFVRGALELEPYSRMVVERRAVG
jgi:hypothetical protein